MHILHNSLLYNISYFHQVFSEHVSSDEPSVSGGMKNYTKPVSSTEPQIDPTLTMLRNMDAVAIAATLRNYIDMIQSLDSLSRNNCLWLFALCVAVDAPLDAETCLPKVLAAQVRNHPCHKVRDGRRGCNAEYTDGDIWKVFWTV